MSLELYKQYRPKNFKAVIGQDSAVKALKQLIKAEAVPHAVLFTGESGCGKTTLARILCQYVDAGEQDVEELNSADFNGIASIRDIRKRMSLSPISGKARVWIIDEAHKMTTDAQNAFLKMTEDTPSHVYFFMATTDPKKLIPTLRNRFTKFEVKPIKEADLINLLKSVCEKEGKMLPDEVLAKIAKNSDKSARTALVSLHKVINLTTTEDMLEGVAEMVDEKAAIDLARVLHNPKAKWPEIAAMLRKMELNDSETIRWCVLGYAKSVLLSGGYLADRAFLIIQAFSAPFYDNKAAGVVAACYEVLHG